MKTVNLQVRVQPLIKSQITVIAQEQGLSPSDVLKEAILGHIRAYEKKNGKISADKLNQTALFSE